ncbi:MAG TPA: hypothetical protein VG603_00635 [Chitinophagales bacterium]|nr:hypothetical protein [Chitinophagales bacterium]
MAMGYKTGGRKKGVPNKNSKEMREKIKDLLEREFEQLGAALEDMSPEKRANMFFKMAPYGLSKLCVLGDSEPKEKDTDEIAWTTLKID